MDRERLIQAARGERQLDLAITNVNLVNVFTCEIYKADIGIIEDRVAIVGPAGEYELDAKESFEGEKKWAVPGFVDTHLHIESSMVTPPNYAAAVLRRGTTTSIIDPHEIGNVLGVDGVKYMIEASEDIYLRVYITVPSSVPSAPGKETAGAVFGVEEVRKMLSLPRVIGVAEVMNYIGVIKGEKRDLDIIQAGLDEGVNIQGHSPLLMGRPLIAYLASGVENDHEIRGGAEGIEKLRLGMMPLLKLSSYGNPLPDVLPDFKSLPFFEVALCTDDIEPSDLINRGHMDAVVREVINQGIDPAMAIRWATINGARHYGLRDHGAIAPGFLADIVLLSSLEEVETSEVFVSGRLVVDGGQLIVPIQDMTQGGAVKNTVRIGALKEEDFRLKAPINNGEVNANVLVYEPSRFRHLEERKATVNDGVVNHKALGDDICLVTVIPRHGQEHKHTIVPVEGLGLKRGALAATIAHDSHNLIVAGHRSSDMLHAVQELEECGGGIVVVGDEDVIAKLELPLAGLMSRKPVEEVAEEVKIVSQAARDVGISKHFHSPALALTGLTLTVTPKVSISDLGGLLDVETQEFIPVFPSEE